MYTPILRKNKTGVPILSKTDIDNIGENFVRDFCPEALQKPMAIDIDSFAQNYRDLQQDFQYLSHNGIYLGMMVFNDTSGIPVYNPAIKGLKFISARARTIIIYIALLEEGQEGRYRFTMGHEVAHDILHSEYYAYNQDQMSFVGMEGIPAVQCRLDMAKPDCGRTFVTDKDWMEWQANSLSSAILMPASMVKKLTEAHCEAPPALRDAYRVTDVCNTFNVSMLAAEVRLRGLGILDGASASNTESEQTLFARDPSH